MIIERIEAIPLRLPYSAEALGSEPLRFHYLVLCRVTTRCGLVGYGEALCYMAPFQRQLVTSILDVAAPLYLGLDVEDRQALNLTNRRKVAWCGRAGANLNAIAAIDIALWDIAGKAKGQSLSALLGNPNPPPIRAIASLDQRESKEMVLELTQKAMSGGATAIKIHEDRLNVAEMIADNLVEGTRLALDTNNRWTRQQMKLHQGRLAALDLLWLEDPIWPPEDLLTEPSMPGIPVAMGADLGSAEQMSLYGAADGVAIVQPDLCMIGGISEMLRIFEIVGPLDVMVAPHTPFIGPAGLATLHLLAAYAPQAFYAIIEAEATMDICGAGLAKWTGEVAVPDGPGLGLDPLPSALRDFAV